MLTSLLFPKSPNLIDYAGYLPGISTVTGAGRIIYGIAKGIFNCIGMWMADSNTQKRKEHRYEALRGMNHAIVGGIEAIPGAKFALLCVSDKNFRNDLTNSRRILLLNVALITSLVLYLQFNLKKQA